MNPGIVLTRVSRSDAWIKGTTLESLRGVILVPREATTIVRLEAFDAQQVRGQSGTITAVVNALAKAILPFSHPWPPRRLPAPECP